MLLGYVGVVSLVLFCMMGMDKYKARHGQYRIAEKTLWIVALAGGALGGWIGMYMFRHKTKHLAFQIGFPFISVLQVILLLYMLNQYGLS
ncbi:uncharacterized protein JNUCC1_03240 [Lentibacillus sp. JNUCC-1]|uniref:DUF1294 domain-containing protein n=1 Tax=Lentibacillus sp. JNUCC-1 TaxID=2654513 RepID=UPI0012E7A94C|nr:DUF1294 domain-containing protein [Lentibacillus sp. JNUCC-1]MUV39364.1 uncharacterized protein [Lentibacillus sp. JNUCC-1]